MAEASESLRENPMLSCPSDSAAMILCLSSLSSLLKMSEKLGCPVIEYWVRATKGTRIGSTSVSRGYGKQYIFRDREHNTRICKSKKMNPHLQSISYLYRMLCQFEAAAGASHNKDIKARKWPTHT